VSCTQIQEDLVALIQGELEPARAEEVQAHVDGCAACREEMGDLRSALEASRVIPPIEPSAGFRERLQTRMESVRSGKTIQASSRFAARRRERTGIRYFLLAAAMLLLVVGITRFIVISEPTSTAALELRLAQQRWEQRAEAPRWQALLEGADVQLPAEIASETLVVVSHHDSAYHENCVALFTDDQIEQLKSNPQIDEKQLGRMLARSVRVSVENGRIRLPGTMLLRNLPASRDGLAVLCLNGRYELWSQKALGSYLQEKPDIEIKLPESQEDDRNLPPEAGVHGEAEAPVI
jgi:hypothetical protein